MPWFVKESGSMSHIYSSAVLDLEMIAPIQLQSFFSYTFLANPELEPHAPKGYSIWNPQGGADCKKSRTPYTFLWNLFYKYEQKIMFIQG